MRLKFIISTLSVVLALSFLLCGCQKELSFEKDGPSAFSPTSADSNYLDKIFFLEDNGSGFDTFLTSTFYYDNLKRNTRIKTVPISPIDIDYDYTFSYSGSEMKPFQTTNYQMSTEDHDTIIRYHSYNASGKLARDSGFYYHHDLNVNVDFSERFVRTYVYSGNMLFSDYQTTFLPPSPPQSHTEYDTCTLDNRGNIIATRHYYLFNGTSLEQYSSDYSYDNKLSPYIKLSSLLSRKEIPDGDSFFEEYSFNNMISSNESYQGNYSFVFNGAGFPIKATALIDDGTGIRTIKLIYTYKILY